MNKLIIKPEGWQCTLEECPPGFFVYGIELCFKTEYGDGKGNCEVYCESGEVFWGGVKTKEERAKLIVQPCISVWEDNE